jgi:hypothetical protein
MIKRKNGRKFWIFLKILATSNASNICGISYADTELKCSGNLGHLVAKYKSYISPGIKRGVERSRPCLVPKNILDFGIVAFSFLFDKYYPIMDYLGSKDSSRQFRPNCVISFYFYLYLILMHVSKDSMWRRIWKILQNFLGTKQGLKAMALGAEVASSRMRCCPCLQE